MKFFEINLMKLNQTKPMKTFKFTWEEIGIDIFRKAPRYPFSIRNRKKFSKNMQNYVKWTVKTAQKIYKKKLKENEKFNSCAFYMNIKNVSILNRSLYPMSWLYISPVTLDELKDDEYGVKIKELVERT